MRRLNFISNSTTATTESTQQASSIQHSAMNECCLFVFVPLFRVPFILPGANPPWRTRADCHTVLITIGKNTPHRRSGSRTENGEDGRAAEGNKWRGENCFKCTYQVPLCITHYCYCDCYFAAFYGRRPEKRKRKEKRTRPPSSIASIYTWYD